MSRTGGGTGGTEEGNRIVKCLAIEVMWAAN